MKLGVSSCRFRPQRPDDLIDTLRDNFAVKAVERVDMQEFA